MPRDDHDETASALPTPLRQEVATITAIDVAGLRARSEVEDLLTTACALTLSLQARIERLATQRTHGWIPSVAPDLLVELASELARVRVVVAEARRRLA